MSRTQNGTRVLLLDAHTIQAYSVSKSLKEAGAFVTVFCEKKLSYGYSSRYPDVKIISPVLKNDTAKYIEFLHLFLAKFPQDVIIPLFNDSAELLSKHKEEIERVGVKIAIPAWEMFIKAHNKESLMNTCNANNLPHPRTAGLSNMTLEDAAANVGFPSLIKPNISAGALGIKYVNNLDELKAKYDQTRVTFGESTLQEYVNHSDYYYNVMIFRYKNGEFSPATVIKILRYFPIKGGSSSYSAVIENPELIAISQRTLNCLKWHGFADFDFIQDKNTKEFKILEINPRIPSCLHAASVSGINFPEIIVCDCLEKPKPLSNYIKGQKLRYISLDILWFFFSENRLRSKPSWFNFFEKNLHFQDGSLSDPIPIFAGIFMGLIKYMNPTFRKGKLKT